MKKLIYDNPLKAEQDVDGFVLEGAAHLSFEAGRLRMSSALPPELEQQANYVLWCDKDFPADLQIEWDFLPMNDVGLCILFWAAKGRNGEDIFSETLAPRTGPYDQYHNGDINAYHLSYYRRRYPEERRFHTCNLRKSFGFHMCAQAGDPIPELASVSGPYHMTVRKKRGVIDLFIDGMPILHYEDDGNTFGPVLQQGKIGFRQMSPMVGEYSNLKVYAL